MTDTSTVPATDATATPPPAALTTQQLAASESGGEPDPGIANAVVEIHGDDEFLAREPNACDW